MAGRRPKPKAYHEAAATHVNRGHPIKRPTPTIKRLGPPPNNLTPEQLRCWNMFVDEIPWLVEADRQILEVLCSLRATFYENDRQIDAKTANTMRLLLGEIGATPTTRSRIILSEDQAREQEERMAAEPGIYF